MDELLRRFAADREGPVARSPRERRRDASVVLARLDGRFPKTPPAQIRVQASADPRINPNTQRTPALAFLVDAKGEKPWSLDLTSSMTPNTPAPGAMIDDAIAQILARDFTQMSKAKSIRANIFMVDVEFRPDQLRALQKFAESIFLN